MLNLEVHNKTLRRSVDPAGETLVVSVLPNGTKGLIAPGHPDVEVVVKLGCAELLCMPRVTRQLFRTFSDSLHVFCAGSGTDVYGQRCARVPMAIARRAIC